MTTSTLNLKAESGSGKFYDTGDDKICVLHLKGGWYEMGQQYGTLAKEHMEAMWDLTVQPFLDKKWITEKEALQLWGRRVLNTMSTRKQQFFHGVAEGIGWPVDRVVTLDQSFPLAMYEGKMHSFSGCTSMSAWGDATKDGNTYVARNMDWTEAFVPMPVYLTVYCPNDGSNKLANSLFPAWHGAATAINDKGLYCDLHDGTSMGGQVLSAERPSLIQQVFDFMSECSSTEALSHRFQGARSDLPSIWMLADRSGDCCSFENTLYDNRKRRSEGDTLVTVNSFMNPDWGIQVRDTVSNSLTRFKNLTARSGEAHGKIDAGKLRDIYDIRLFNEDGTFKENGGVTKPSKQDADLTNFQMVSDLSNLEVWLKVPPRQTDWRHVDLKPLFAD